MFAGINADEWIIVKILSGSAVLGALLCSLSFAGSFSPSWIPKFGSNMSGQAVPVDLSGQMLDLEEDDDLEVFTKVKVKHQNRPNLHFTRPAAGFGTWLQTRNL